MTQQVAEQVSRITEEVEAACSGRISEVREHQRAAERRLAAALETTRHAREAADRAQSRLFEVSSAAEDRLGALQVISRAWWDGILCSGVSEGTLVLQT